jgi:FKBP-type peptidyl-prolyl cis-trans isomerase FkpA
MFQKFIICLFVFPLFTSLNAQKSKFKGFEITKTGLHYRFITLNKNALQAKEDSTVLDVAMTYYVAQNDSLLFSTKDAPNGTIQVALFPSTYKGDIMEGIRMLHIGDSVQFITPIDSFFLKTAQSPVPAGIPSGKDLKIAIKVIGIQTRAQQIESQKKQLEEQDKMSKENKIKEATTIAEYILQNGITEKPTASGLYYIETVKGNGEKPSSGKKVSVHYTGYLLDGKKFDSSVDRGQPFQFTLGAGQVIKGWDEGVALMSVGTSAKLLLPSSIAYGPNGAGGVIPPFAPLLFEVQLLKIENGN